MKKQQKETKQANDSVELSIVIVTFNNTKEISPCLKSLYNFYSEEFSLSKWQLILWDNASSDDTVKVIEGNKENYPGLTIVKNSENLGFAGANNEAVKLAKGKYVLLLNADTIVEKNSISEPLAILKTHPDFGAVGIKMLLGNGQLDYSCHRGFPTPWNSLTYFSGLTKIFPKNRLFSGYTLGFLDVNSSHEVDAINGAYFLTRKQIGDQLGWFDKDFFWNGEDLDLCYRIKEAGYKIFYYADAKIIHYKGSSGGHKPGSKTFHSRFDVMKLFYDKHYKDKYPGFLRSLVLAGISTRKLVAYLGV